MNNGNGLVNLDGGHKCLLIVSSRSFRAVQFSIEALAVAAGTLLFSTSERKGEYNETVNGCLVE